MKITFLSKRQYMRKDVIDERYGRIYELPSCLAERGHEILGLCLSYRRRNEGLLIEEATARGLLQWHSYNLWPSLYCYYKRLSGLISQLNPDVLIGTSDSLHVIFTACLAKRFNIPYAIDLYDNFESFGLTRIPGIKPLFQAAVRNAQAVFCVSHPLADYVRNQYRARGVVMTLESTIDTRTFLPHPSLHCRSALNLPINAKLIGTAGALDDKSRDTRCLYHAFDRLSAVNPDIHLVLAGRPDKTTPIPQGERVHYLGEIPHYKVPLLFNALDVAVIGMKDDAFGRFAFPQKAYEIMACQTPVVCSAIGALRQLLHAYPACLYQAGNAADLAEKIAAQLDNRILPALPIPDWATQAEHMEKVLQRIVR